MRFIKKKLAAGATVGNYLAELMSEEGMTAFQVAEALHVQERHVNALLVGDAAKLPGAFYTKHLVRQFTALLDGNVEYAEKLFARGMSEDQHTESPKRMFDRKKVRSSSMLVVARLVTGTMLAGVFVLLLVSFGGNIQNALTPPPITLLNPTGDLVTSDRELKVEGKTDPEVTLKVNGEQVVTDDAGVFSVPLYLDDGLNIIEVRAAKRYSKDQVIYRRVLVEPKDAKEISSR